MRQKFGICAVVFFVSLCLIGIGVNAHSAEKTKQPAKSSDSAKSKKTTEKTGSADAIATVNNVPIKRAAYDAEVKRYEQQLTLMGQTPDAGKTAEMKNRVLDGLIGREVLRQEADRQKIKVEPAEVDKQIDALKKRFPSPEEYEATLKKMNTTESELKANFTQDLAIRKLVDQEVGGKVVVTPEETKKYYESNPTMFKRPETIRASHILVKVDQNASEADKAKAKEKITEIQKRIQKGEDFAVVAKEVSDCPSKEKGGDLGTFARGQMVGPFEQAAFALKPGEVSGIVETQFGFHIIKLVEKKEAGDVSFEEVQEKLVQHLRQEKLNKEIGDYIEQLKSKAVIKKS